MPQLIYSKLHYYYLTSKAQQPTLVPMNIEKSPPVAETDRAFERELRFGGFALQCALILSGLGAFYGAVLVGRPTLTPIEFWSASIFAPFAFIVFLYSLREPSKAVAKVGLPVSIVCWIYIVLNTWSVAQLAPQVPNILVHLMWGAPLCLFFFVVLPRSIALGMSAAATFMQGLALFVMVLRLGDQVPDIFINVATVWGMSQCATIALVFGVSRLLEVNIIDHATIRARLETTQKEYALLAQMQDQRDRYRRLIESSLDVFVELSPDGTILDISANCAALFGYTPDEIIGEVFYSITEAGSRAGAKAAFQEVIKGNPSQAIEQVIRAKDGTEVHIFTSAVYSPQDNVVFAIVRDLRERMAQEERARHATRLEALGQLTGGIAHDFNNLLTVMIGEVERVDEIIEKRAITGIDLSRLQRATDGAFDLTRRLLSFSRKQSLRLERTNLRLVVDRSVALLSSSIGSKIKLSMKIEDAWAFIDASELQAAIINLMVNARDAMPEGGAIELSCRPITLNRPLDYTWGQIDAGSYAVVTVRDTGIGIAYDVLPKIVEPYFTTKGLGMGTGLGLSMALQLTKRLKGGLAIKSEIGKGTSVSLFVPLDQ